MIPITQKLTKKAANEGHSSFSWCQRWSPAGTVSSSTSRVIATAKTPSLKASSRFLVKREWPSRRLPGTIENRLGHRRMRMDDPLQLGIAALEGHHVDELGNHVAGAIADDVRAE